MPAFTIVDWNSIKIWITGLNSSYLISVFTIMVYFNRRIENWKIWNWESRFLSILQNWPIEISNLESRSQSTVDLFIHRWHIITSHQNLFNSTFRIKHVISSKSNLCNLRLIIRSRHLAIKFRLNFFNPQWWICHLMDTWSKFLVARCPSSCQPTRIREDMLESSAVVEFLPLYHCQHAYFSGGFFWLPKK